MLKTVSIAVLASVLSVGSAYAGMLNEHNPNMRFESVSPALPELNERFVRNGKSVSVGLVRQIELGATPEQVSSLLGQPVRVTNRGGAQVWDYNLQFKTAEDGDIVCQYKVLFAGARQVDETVWRRPQCRELVLGHN
ncbi:outer membrane protein assembly factor BamE domain-containing protein [Martelella soudanensis]|uniref:outer membrane protein assembly factor BamE domain-containing protein n=1 Tax=unclassified Martelella TaxID=2629616 RepID=UPI0015DF712F|nr:MULTISPECIES: outer membrane protein assembly factor BamE [unclassified Martelella]